MYRFVLLAMAIICGTIVALRQEGAPAEAAPGPTPVWNQVYTALPATHVAPFSPGSTWSGRLNPAATVFDSGFRAFYFDRTQPSVRPIERQVDAVALAYSYDELQGIDSLKLGAYWVGRVKFDADTLRRINLRLSHATARLFIDGKLIHEGGTSHSVDYRFSPGFHLLEVDYANGWHTTDFAVTLTEPYPIYSRDDIASQLKQLKLADYDVYYFGAYDTAGGNVEVRLPESPRPAIVWLDSYEPVTWSVDTTARPVWAVVASHEPGASIVGATRDRVFLTHDGIGVHSEGRTNCECIRGRSFHCESYDSIMEAADTTAQLLGKTMAGYALAEDASAMTVRPYDATTLRRLQRAEADVARREKLCRA